MGQQKKGYIYLAELIQKERDPLLQEEVERILDSSNSIYEKVEYIEKLDRAQRETDARRQSAEGRKGPVGHAGIDGPGKKPPVTLRQAADNRKRIMRPFKRNESFTFWFFDFRRIIRFFRLVGRKSDYIMYRIFPPKLALNRRVKHLFESIYQKIALELMGPLDKILEKGWLVLTKHEYNIIAQYALLNKKLYSLDFRSLDFTRDRIHEQLQMLQDNFIACHYREEYPDLLVDSINKIIDKNPEWGINARRVSVLVKKILLPDAMKPSLYNLILAMNMVRYRRFVRLEDLFDNELREIVSNYDYDCEPAVRADLKNHIDNMKEKLYALVREQDEIKRYEAYLPMEDGNLDYNAVIYFYEKSLPSLELKFHLDRTKSAFFIYHYCYLLMKEFEDILIGTVQADDVRNLRIFEKGYFQNDVDKFMFQIEKMKKYEYLFSQFPEERFADLHAARKTGTQSEIELLQIVSEVSEISREVVNKLIAVMRSHYAAPTLMEEEETLEPVNASQVAKMTAVIPGAPKIIMEGNAVKGQSVERGIREIVTLFLHLLIYVRDDYIMTLLGRKNRVAGEISLIMEELQRMATADELKEIRETCKI